MKTKALLLAVLAGLSQWSNTAAAATLVSEWKFEDNLNDTSGNGNHGTATGAPTFVAGRFGQGVSLATADLIQKTAATGLPMAGNASWSMNLWVNLSAPPDSLAYVAGFGPVLDTGVGTARGFLNFSGGIYSWGNSVDLGTGIPYPTGRWAMLTFTHNGADNLTTIYLDGASIASGAQALANIPGAENKISLAPVSNWGSDLAGSFDEFSIWEGVLTAPQIANLFVGGNGLVAQKVVEWKFENNLSDTSGFENHGTATGSPTFVAGRFGQAASLASADMIQNTAARFLPMTGNASWSMNLWVNLPDAPPALAYIGGFGPVLDTGAGTARGFLNFSGGIYSWGNSVDLSTGIPYPTGRWAMLTLTHNGADNLTTVYLDATSIGSGAQALANIPGAENKISLAPVSNWGSDFAGSFDEFTVWNGVLSLSQIRQLFGLGPELVITRQPADLTRFAGEAAALSVAAAGGVGDLAYQWRRNDADVSGATNTTLRFASLATASAGTYTVVVSDTGGHSLTSAPAVLTVTAVAGITDALAGYWNFDEGTGALLIDNSGNDNNGALNNFPDDDSQWVSAGRIGGALNFRGPANGEFVKVDRYPQSGGTMSVSAWVWADARPQWATVIKNWADAIAGQFHFGLFDTAGDISNFIQQQGGGTPNTREAAAIPLGSWQHVAFVCDGAQMRIYRNGVQVAVTAYNGSLINPSPLAALSIGAKLNDAGTAASGQWQGKIDDLGLWTRGLSADEILAIYSAGVNGNPLNEAIVGAVAPSIGSQPQDQTTDEGGSATFTVGAAGTSPLAYQWYRNGAAISGETNSSLTLNNLCAGESGGFSVVVCNAVGCVTSAPPATISITPLPTTLITAGLTGHWKFDETSGVSASDSTDNANAGVLNNFPGDNSQWVAGQIGGALSFSGQGSQNWVYVANYPKPTTTMTISAWVLANSRPTWASIAKNWGGATAGQFHFGLNAGDGDLSNYQIDNGGGLFVTREGAQFPLGTWQHVAFVCDGAQMRIYRNGAQVASTPYNGTILNTPVMSSLAIGCKTDDSGLVPDGGAPGFWDGKMDDMGLWNRGLGASEIRAIYLAGLEGRSLTEASPLPHLRIVRSGGDVIISWPAAPVGKCFMLEQSDVLPAATWSPAGVATLTADRYSVTVSAANGHKFYRLQKQ